MRQTIVIENDKGQQYNVETNRIYTSDTLPTRNITEGSIYVDNATKEVKIYIGAKWQKVQVGTGNIEELLKGKADINHTHTEYATNDKVDLIKQNLENNKVDKVDGKGLSSNDFTNTLLSKLNGIDSGAEKNKVNSVAGKTGSVVLNKSDVGLSSVENITSQELLNKMTKSNITKALGFTPESNLNKDQPSGYAGLDSKGKLKLSVLPDIAKQSMFIVSTQLELNGLENMMKGDRAYVTNDGNSFIYDGKDWLVLAKADWENINLEWQNIVDKPTSGTAAIDNAVKNSHTHSNLSSLNKINDTLLNNIEVHLSDTAKHLTEASVNSIVKAEVDKLQTLIYSINGKFNNYALKTHNHTGIYVEQSIYNTNKKATDDAIKALQREAQESSGVVFMDEYIPVDKRSEGVCYLNIL